jgi:hypothetical protein
MTLKRINLSLHKTIHHKAYLLEDDNNDSLVDQLLERNKHSYPSVNKEELVLFDMDTKEIIEKFNNIEKVNLDKYSPENLILSSFYSSLNTIIKIPASVNVLSLDGGSYMDELMSKTEKSSRVWDEFIYEGQLHLFDKTLEDRIERYKVFRTNTTLIKNLKLDSPISILLSHITTLKLNTLRIERIYLSESDLNLLSKMKQLEQLELAYIFNDYIQKLPPNLKKLLIYGSTIENLSDIDLKGLPLEQLSLAGNAIKNLDGITKIKNLTTLDIDDNLLRYLDLNELPKNIKMLSLNSNIIENDFFEGKNSEVVNKKITHLDLSKNNLIINPWLIYRITEMFPMLEYIDLSGNYNDGVPDYILVNDEEYSSMASIKFWLNTQDYKHTGSYLDMKTTFNYYDSRNVIIIKWQHQSLPTKLILSDIQLRFSSLFELMPEFKLYREGIYCDIVHDNISLVIREEANILYLEFYTSNGRILNDYFYKYFQEINNFIKLNTHHPILPVANFSENCVIYEKFFKFVFHIDKKILDNFIVIPNDGEPMALIKTQKKGLLAENKNNPGNHYKKMQHIAFIIITTRESFPYIIDDNNSVSNIEEITAGLRSAKAFELSLKEGVDKKNYVDALTNPYLGNNRMEQAVVFAKDDTRYPRNIIFNPNYFYVDSNKLFRKSSNIEMSKYVVEPIVEEKIEKGQMVWKEITITFDGNNKMCLENIKFPK